ncbi:MAG: hypothetical protein R3E32_00040 [Chitinophagales bacterium]
MNQPKDKILILTPVKDATKHLSLYFQLLENLSYPKELISLGFLEGDSRDDTFGFIEGKLLELNTTFRRANIWKRDYSFVIPDGLFRWSSSIQIERRSILAKSRNYLLSRALEDEDWVLWLDVDLIEYPKDVIEQLLAVKKEIVHPNTVKEYGGKSYDMNAWSDKGKYFLSDLKEKGKLVKIHGVGGTMLLVKADIHREGLVFPTFLFGHRSPLIRASNHFFMKRDLLKKFGLGGILNRQFQGEIETEGLGIMAYEMGYECWGMPHLEILHANE